MPDFFDKIEDWSRIIKQFTSDIYSNYYKVFNKEVIIATNNIAISHKSNISNFKVRI